jgi:hypothetical protein
MHDAVTDATAADDADAAGAAPLLILLLHSAVWQFCQKSHRHMYCCCLLLHLLLALLLESLISL